MKTRTYQLPITLIVGGYKIAVAGNGLTGPMTTTLNDLEGVFSDACELVSSHDPDRCIHPLIEVGL